MSKSCKESFTLSQTCWSYGPINESMDDRAAKMILYGELEYSSRSFGRSKLRFKDNRKQLLKLVDLFDRNVVAMDRPLWRSKIISVCDKLNSRPTEKYQQKKQLRKYIFFLIRIYCQIRNVSVYQLFEAYYQYYYYLLFMFKILKVSSEQFIHVNSNLYIKIT